jgi:pyruvate, orthophosphate dikinase
VLRIDPEHLEQMLYPRLSPAFKGSPLPRACRHRPVPHPGSRYSTLTAPRPRATTSVGRCILVREETKPEDIHGFFAAKGILTSRGGKTSHAAVVARGMGKPCVAGAEGIQVDVARREAHVGGQVIREGDMITIDGSSGNVYLGQVPMIEPEFSDELNQLLRWADDVARLHVKANADTPEDAARALASAPRGSACAAPSGCSTPSNGCRW